MRESTAALVARRVVEHAPTRAEWLRFRSGERAGGAGAREAALSGGTTLVPRAPHPKPTVAAQCADVRQFNVVRVKFVEGSHIRLDANGGLYSDNGPAMTPALHAELAQINARPDTQRQPTMATPIAELLWSKEDAEKESGEEHADPTLWFDMLDGTSLVEAQADPIVCARTASFVNWLNAMQIIEVAYPVPAAVEPPTIPFMNPGYDVGSAFTYTLNEPPHMAPWDPPNMSFGLNSPEASALLDPAFRFMWHGEGVNLVDMEYNWFWHEKIGDVYRIPGGELLTGASGENHGVAAMSTAFGTARSYNSLFTERYGTRGFAPFAGRAFSAHYSFWGTHAADGVERARNAMDAEDVLLLEAQTHSGIGSAVVGGPPGYIPVEYEEAAYDAIRRATANGRIVIEPTGNGALGYVPNVDALTGGRLNSGAIIVAANNATTQAGMPFPFTGFGARVDANAWGAAVQCASAPGYTGSNLSPAGTPRQDNYVGNFSGTSSASASVSGAVAQMVAVHQGAYGRPLAPHAQVAATVRSLIRTSDVPPLFDVQGRAYGVQPNVERAVAEYVLATRLHSVEPYASTPHTAWVTASTSAGILPLSWFWGGAWLITAAGAAGVTLQEFPVVNPTGPLDLGWNPDRSFTLEARIYVPDVTNGWQTIIAKENPRNYGLWVAPNWYHPGRLHFSYQPDGTNVLCGAYSDQIVADAVPHHIALRFDRRESNGSNVPPTITFFVDGIASGSSVGCTTSGPAASGSFGENSAGVASQLALGSVVGDLRLYHRFVTNAEIARHASGS